MIPYLQVLCSNSLQAGKSRITTCKDCPLNIFHNTSSNINLVSSEEVVIMFFLIFVLTCGCFQLVEHYGDLIVVRLIPGS